MIIQIDSFQWWLSNDKNVGTATFWNSKNIEYRKNSSYIELAKWVQDGFSTSTDLPISLQYWYNWGTIVKDNIVAFCTNGNVYTSTWFQGQVWAWARNIVNTIEANGIKYILTTQNLYRYDTVSTYTLLKTFTATVNNRPAIVFWGDLIVWDGNQVLRYNYDWTLVEFTAWASTTVIGNLDWTVMALTTVGSSVYVWCNSGTNTNLYIWDWISGDWSQKVVYSDMPVRNVALLGNQHYWWSNKGDNAIRKVNIGEWYGVQTYAKSDYPLYPISTQYDAEENRLALSDYSITSTNAIETIADIVYLPWVGSIYGFWKYFPNQNASIAREYTFTGTTVFAMLSGGIITSGADTGSTLAFSYLGWSTGKVWLINMWVPHPWLGLTYATSGEIESMEYIATSFAQAETNKKMLIPFNLPHSSTSIKMYQKIDRWSYSLIKTLTTTDFGTGYKLHEIKNVWKWSTIQFKFELIGDWAHTPQLGMGIINESTTTWDSR